MQMLARRRVVAGAAVLTGLAGTVTALVLPSADAKGVPVPEFGHGFGAVPPGAWRAAGHR